MTKVKCSARFFRVGGDVYCKFRGSDGYCTRGEIEITDACYDCTCESQEEPEELDDEEA